MKEQDFSRSVTPMISILYVDDEPGLLEIGKLFLENTGIFSVKTVTSATEALEILRSGVYGAIISDYQMPDMNGIEFLRQVRASGNPIPFIIFTGRGREEVVIQALNEGADFYIQKGGEPVSQFTELAHKVHKAILHKKAEASVREHERRETDIINFLPDATFAIDTSGVVIAWNRAMEKMTGVKSEQVLGKGNYEYAIPFYHERRPILIDLVLDYDPAIANKYQDIQKDGKNLFSEITIPHFHEGRGAALWFTASPLYDTQGTIVGAIESIREITERKRAEEALNESERRFRELSDMLPQVVYEADAGGNVTYANRIAFEMFGYTEEKIKSGVNVLEIIAPEDRDRVATAFRLILNGGSRKHSSEEYLALRSDGSTFPASIYSSPVLQDGRIVGVRGILVDITDRKLAEERVRESEQNYRLLFENATEGILVAQGDRMVNINPALINLLDRPADVITSRPFTDFIHPDDRELVMGRHIQRMKGETPYTGYMFRIITGAGHEKWVWINSTRMTWSGNPASLSFLTDMTERKAAEESLISANNEYTNLLNQIQDIYYRSDAEGRLIKASRSWAALLGYDDLSECLGRSIADDFYANPGDRKKFLEEIHTEGKVRWQRWSDRAIFDPSGILIEYQSVGRDITDTKVAEEALRESEERFRGMAERSSDLIFILDQAMSISYVSPSARSIIGYEPEELVGKPVEFVYSTIFSDSRPAFENALRANKRGVTIENFEMQIRKKDGDIVYVNVHALPVMHDGAFAGAQVSMRDITAWKRSERALRESDERYRSLSEASRDLIFVIDRDDRITYVNNSAAQMFGISAGDLIGRKRSELFPSDISEGQLRAIRKVFETGEGIRSTGKLGLHEKMLWFDHSLMPVRNESGEVTQVLGISRDITEQKRVEEALRTRTDELDTRNRVLNTLLDTVPIGIFMVEVPSGTPIVANQEATRLLGRGILPDATEENLGRVYEAFQAGSCKQYPTEEMPIVRGMRGESSHVDDMVVVRPDETRVQLEIFGNPVLDQQNRVIASIVSFLDVTKRKREEQLLLETNKKINLLGSITRHDVANQVSIMRGYAKIAMMDNRDPAIEDLLSKIDSAGSVIMQQIDFTNAYGKLGLNSPEWYRISGLVDQMNPEHIALTCDCNNTEILADPMLEKVFFNLVDNAIRHGERVTEITVRCETGPSGLSVFVEDDGIGIPPDKKERIFEKGYGKNTGLGLFLAREILAITGISIRETGAPGKGARFELQVPRRKYRSG